ncbi:hypothetical protein N1027_06705 [Herbiconiux sp. CPCC 205763]|uniref:Uncharacterized protein n=1 Tax=Herbiconiux aconitum TaxID=2970913 RepID=A0ABT2GNL7_9MICO|nr:hypothetical protein [Herbiconiux aconitum]MCS5717823.1 hypothetical protein [Herbiconiux aconitum]
MGRHYRRSVSSQPAVVAEQDSSDPYAAYLSWVERGKPSLSGGGASNIRPEAGTVLMSEHVQVQELSGLPGAQSKSSPWQRLVEIFRR